MTKTPVAVMRELVPYPGMEGMSIPCANAHGGRVVWLDENGGPHAVEREPNQRVFLGAWRTRWAETDIEGEPGFSRIERAHAVLVKQLADVHRADLQTVEQAFWDTYGHMPEVLQLQLAGSPWVMSSHSHSFRMGTKAVVAALEGPLDQSRLRHHIRPWDEIPHG